MNAYVITRKDMRDRTIKVTINARFSPKGIESQMHGTIARLLRHLNHEAFNIKAFLKGIHKEQRYYPEIYPNWAYIKDSYNNDEVLYVIALAKIDLATLNKATRLINKKEE